MDIAGFEVPEVIQQAFRTKYPTVDLQREYPLMVLWITKNPAKRPKNAIRFIENWLKKVQANDMKALNVKSLTAERIGSRYGVSPRPGETQEQYNQRVIHACASATVLRRVA